MPTSHNIHNCQSVTIRRGARPTTLKIEVECEWTGHIVTLHNLPPDEVARIVEAVNTPKVEPAQQGTKPIVPWDALSDDIQWVARDEDGYLFGYSNKPEVNGEKWDACNLFGLLSVKIDPGTCHWRDSLVQRPAK